MVAVGFFIFLIGLVGTFFGMIAAAGKPFKASESGFFMLGALGFGLMCIGALVKAVGFLGFMGLLILIAGVGYWGFKKS